MIPSRFVIIALVPALLILGIIFGIRVFQYRVLFSEPPPIPAQSLDLIPILPNDPILGSRNAPKTVIAFEDFACEGCNAQHTLLNDLETKHPGKVKIIWKGLPVAIFPFTSQPAHEYAYCSNKQKKFDEFTKLTFTNANNLSKDTLENIITELGLNNDAFRTCLASGAGTAYIESIRTLARAFHVQQVPTFFLDNVQISAPGSVEAWEVILGL